MIVVLFAAAAMVVSAPIFAALVVSIASRREDENWSLGEPARTRVQAVARRIVAFDADSIDWPQSKARQQAKALQQARALRQAEGLQRVPVPEAVWHRPEATTSRSAPSQLSARTRWP
jgi:hypothetical protein